MRSTTEFGNATSLAIHSANDGSNRRAASTTRARRMRPFSCRLSREAKTGGASPLRRRWANASAMSDGADGGASEGSRLLWRDLVALLRDGQRHEVRAGRRDGVERGGRPRLHGGQCADDAQGYLGARLPLRDGVQPVLRRELVLSPGAPDGDRP